MKDEKSTVTATDTESATLVVPPESDVAVKTLRSTSFRTQCFIMLLLMITVISLAVGLGVGLKSNHTASSNNTESIAKVSSSWPELVGWDAENASAWMKEHYPEYKIHVVDYDAYVTEDYDPKRVRIYKAPNGTVYVAPKIGR
jgi:Potato inhibitor I family